MDFFFKKTNIKEIIIGSTLRKMKEYSNIQKSYLKNGYYIFNIDDIKKINYLRDTILKYSKNILKLKKVNLNQSQKY